jgi:hypothetical protein
MFGQKLGAASPSEGVAFPLAAKLADHLTVEHRPHSSEPKAPVSETSPAGPVATATNPSDVLPGQVPDESTVSGKTSDSARDESLSIEDQRQFPSETQAAFAPASDVEDVEDTGETAKERHGKKEHKR